MIGYVQKILDAELIALEPLKWNISQIREIELKDLQKWISELQKKAKVGQTLCIVLILPAVMTLRVASNLTMNVNQSNPRIGQIRMTT
jgi:hypothetical protein